MPLLHLSSDAEIFASEIRESNFLSNCYCKNMISPSHFMREWSQIIPKWFQGCLNKCSLPNW